MCKNLGNQRIVSIRGSIVEDVFQATRKARREHSCRMAFLGVDLCMCVEPACDEDDVGKVKIRRA